MTQAQTHQQDCLEILRQDFQAGRIGRRAVLGAMAALGLSSLATGQVAKAAGGELVVANWGGDAVPAFNAAFKPSYEATSGRKLVVDGGGPSMGKIRTMVDARNVIWDLCDSGAGDSIELGRLGMLEPIDYGIVDKEKMLPGFAYQHGCANYMFSVVLAYNAAKYKDKPPTKLADFWDTRNFPGRRLLRKRGLAMLEMALIADGVPFDQVYPIDIDRALKKIRQIKGDALFWLNGAESQQFLREGECDMGLIWHTRASVLHRDTKGRITWTFNQGILHPGIWIVPRGNPAGPPAAMQAIAAMQAPEGQVKLLELLGNGPANPAAQPLVPAALRDTNPTDPRFVPLQLASNGEWWGAHVNEAEEKYLDMINS
jgi:putative spermidine/putrescine transport system substrate-binding protein